MVSKLASVHFNALIKILSNASKLACQAAVPPRRTRLDLVQARWSSLPSQLTAGPASDVQCSFIHFR